MASEHEPKKGRPTIADNFLFGSRNAWLSFLEECWPEVGWPLLGIRKGSGTIEDIQRAFALVAGKERYSLALVFLRGIPEAVAAKEVRANRIRASHLHCEIREIRSQHRDLEVSCAEAGNALRQASDENSDVIQKEAEQRKTRLLEHAEKLRRAESESRELDMAVQNQETYWYCAQLLDFLRTGKYAVDPLNVANTMAGLPQMGWHASLARCSRMPRNHYVHFAYRVFEVVSWIWRRRPRDVRGAPIEFFRIQILKLPKKDDGTRDILCRSWRDLRLAIEECWQAKHPGEFMPYAITAAFIRNNERVKTAEERIMHEREMLATNRTWLGQF